MNSHTLRNTLGKEFALFTGRGSSGFKLTSGIKPMVFSDQVYATQFVNSLRVSPSFWRKISFSQTVQTCRHSSDSDIVRAIALQLVAGHFSVYALDASASTSSVPKAKRSLQGANNTTVEFAPASALNAQGLRSQANKPSFASVNTAIAFIDTLSPNEAELQQIAKGIGIEQQSTTTDEDALKRLIAQKLTSGEATVDVQQRKNETQLEHIEAESASSPSQPSLGPGAAPTTANVVSAVASDADQVAALLQAAEEGTPFCEECAAEEEAQAGAENAQSPSEPSNTNEAETSSADQAQTGEAAATPALSPTNSPSENSEPSECGVCTLKEFDVTCSHGRKQGLSRKLRVVPDPDQTRNREVSMLGVKVALKEEFGGKETLSASAVLEGNKRGDCAYITNEVGEWLQANSQDIVLEGTLGENLDKWPASASPVSRTVKAKACTGGDADVEIQVYPNQRYTVEANFDVFKDWVDRVNEGWERWAATIFSYAPVDIKPKLTGPTGSFSASWGWKEDSDWRAYYDINASFGLNPIFGVELEIALSAMKLAATMAGLPPALGKVAADHLADIQLSLGAGCKGSIMGSPHAKKYPDDLIKVTGEAKFAVEGLIKIGFKVRAGSDYIASVSIICSGESKVVGSDIVDISEEGIFAQTAIELEPLIATVKVEYRYLKVYTKSKDKKWTPWAKKELYKSDKVNLIPN